MCGAGVTCLGISAFLATNLSWGQSRHHTLFTKSLRFRNFKLNHCHMSLGRILANFSNINNLIKVISNFVDFENRQAFDKIAHNEPKVS